MPFAVQSEERANVLVVLPVITWLGTDRSTTTVDGLPNTLADGGPVR